MGTFSGFPFYAVCPLNFMPGPVVALAAFVI